MPGMLRKSTAFVPRNRWFESISLQRRVGRTSTRAKSPSAARSHQRACPPANSRANSGTDLEGRRVTPMRPMADSRRGAVAGQLRREPWRTNAETVAIITAGIGGIYLRPNWASRGGEMARGQGFVKVQSSQRTWFSLPAAQADRVAGLRETCRKPRWKGRERRQKGEKGDKKRGVGGPVSALACSSARSRNAPPSSSIGDGSAPGPCRARPYNL